jgi:large subunit ribosomal protein L22
MATVETPATEVRAEARWVRSAPRKAQLVVGEIRGLPVGDALTTLSFMTRAAARDVESVLKSAIANAEANHDLDADTLYVSAAYVGEGPTLKRWKARARGRVGRIHKRTCHITVRVAPIPGAVAPEAPAAPARRSRAAKPADVVETPVVPTETPAEEKPTRASRAKKPAEAEAADAAVEPAAEEKPKPARSRKPKAEPAAEDAPAPGAAGAEPAPAAEEKPKRARSRKPAESTPEGASTEAEDATAEEEK